MTYLTIPTNARDLLLESVGADDISARFVSNAKNIVVSATSQVFNYATAGATAGQYITVNATRANTNNPITWTTVPAGIPLWTAATGGTDIKSTSSQTTVVYLRVADFDTAITAATTSSIQVVGTVTDGTAIYDSTTIVKLQQGSSALSVVLSNESANIATDSAGLNAVYTGTGTNIYVYEGSNALAFQLASTLTNGTWKVSASGTGIIAGSPVVDSGSYATYDVANSIGDAVSNAYITYTITGKSSTGIDFTVTKVQNFSKSKQGIAGNYVDYMFQRSNTDLATAPTGNTPAAPWYDAPPSGTALLWVTSAEKTYAGVLVGTWSTPAKIGGEGVTVEYSIDGSTVWHPVFVTNDIYMRQTIGTGTPSSAIRIVGEKGDTGAPGYSIITVSGNSDQTSSTNAYLRINGTSIGTVLPGRGHNLKVIDTTTSTLVIDNFYDTYSTNNGAATGGSIGNANDLATYINGITNTNYVIVLYSSDATQCTTTLRTAINNKGGSSDLTWTAAANPTTYAGYSHVFIGAPGLLKGQGFEKVNSVTAPNSGYSTPVAVSTYFTTLGLVVNGVSGVSGTDGVAAYLTNPTHNLQATSTGTLLAGEAAAASTSFVVLEGGADVTSSYSFSAGTPSTGFTISGANPFTVSTLTVDSGYVDLTATSTRSGYANIVLRFSVARLKAAADGTSPVLVYLTANYQGILYNENGVTPSPTITTFTATPKNAVGTITYVFKVDGTVITSSGTIASYNLPASIFTTPISVVVEMKSGTTIVATDNLTITATKIGATGAIGPAGSIIIEASSNGAGAGYNDINTSYLKVDNIVKGNAALRGHRLIIYDRNTGVVSNNSNYDTYYGEGSSPVPSSGGATSLANAINAITDTNKIIVLISADATACNADLRTAINAKGGTLSTTWANIVPGVAHVFIGAPGLSKGQGFEKTSNTGVIAVSTYFTTATGLIVNGAAGYTPIKGIDYFDGTPSTVPGADGATALFAYQLLYNATSIPTAPVIGVNASINIATATIGGGWCSIPVSSTLAAGYYQFQVSGTFKASTQVYTWQTQSYLSNFKVGTLDALSANIGTLRTAVNGPRTEIADNIIRVYDAQGALRVKLGNLSL